MTQKPRLLDSLEDRDGKCASPGCRYRPVDTVVRQRPRYHRYHLCGRHLKKFRDERYEEVMTAAAKGIYSV